MAGQVTETTWYHREKMIRGRPYHAAPAQYQTLRAIRCALAKPSA